MARVLVMVAVGALLAVSAEDTSTPKPKKVLDAVMTPAYIPAEEKHSSYWKRSAKEHLKLKLAAHHNKNKAKNAILFIGDGMSMATIMAARTYAGQLDRGLGEENILEFEKMPVSGLARTYCLDAQVPDSACTATSYLTGVKTKYGVIGLDGNVTRGACSSQLHKGNWASSIGQWALDQGLDVGLVTTTRVTHASPAGMYAHTSERNWESDADVPEECLSSGCHDIAYQLIANDPGRRLKVIMGGGRREFLPNTTQPDNIGRRLDKTDLLDLWHEDKAKKNVTHQYVTDRNDLLQAVVDESSCPTRRYRTTLAGGWTLDLWHEDKAKKNVTHQYVTDRNDLLQVFNAEDMPEYLLGLFNNDHMSYHLKAQNEPTLEEMVEVAIKMLSRSPKGYFLFVEGGRIDHAHHDSLAHLALDETVEYSKAVKKAKSLTSEEDTLIVVSADHAHTMTVSGYPSRGNDILGIVDTAIGMDGVPYTAITYANGKAHSISPEGKRVDVTLSQQFQSQSLDYSYPSLVPLDSETHGGEDVAVYSSGPWSHLFTASFEQSAIPHFIAYAMCLGDDHHVNCRIRNHHNGFWTNSANYDRPSVVSVLLLSLCAVITSLRLF